MLYFTIFCPSQPLVSKITSLNITPVYILNCLSNQSFISSIRFQAYSLSNLFFNLINSNKSIFQNYSKQFTQNKYKIINMFDQSSRQKKQKNWKILNLNPIDVQQQPHYNRSIITDSTKKYCPRKNSSQQKIFSKSKDRLNLSKPQNSDKQPFQFKAGNKQVNSKPPSYSITKNGQNHDSNHGSTEVKRNSKYQQVPQYQQKLPAKSQFQVHEEYQTGQKPNMSLKRNEFNNFQFEQILNSSKLNTKNTHDYQILQQQINQNAAIVSDLREKFETFKSIVLQQLEQEKEFLRRSVERMTEEFMFMKERIREEVIAQLQLREFPNGFFGNNKKNFTDFRHQDNFISKELLQEELGVADSLNMIKLETFGKIQQPNSSERMFGLKMEEGYKMEENQINISQIQEHKNSGQIQENSFASSQKQNQKVVHESKDPKHNTTNANVFSSINSVKKNNNFGTETQISDAIMNRQIPTRQLRTYKSSGNFAQQSVPQPQTTQPLPSQPRSPSQYMSEIQSMVSKKRIDQCDQMQRFSEILKRQYEEKAKSAVQVTRLDREKINERMNHVYKFQGAMQKLKSEIMEFKNLSDTRDIKKIKFSQQKQSEKYLKVIKLNQINVDSQFMNQQISKGF